ncbi:MAG: glycosyltransferase family 2 protein [Nitrospirae bacterium]|nr:glycosyltransferase family 2 protein [Nitrospirota bacterium]
MLTPEIELTVIIPVYNEEENIGPLIGELFPVLRNTGRPFEVIYVDDFSTDNSFSVLEEMKKRYAELRVVRHRSNFGQSAAVATGFAHARGNILITLDGDQQNDPADIPLLLEVMGNFDAVCGVRKKREDNWVRKVSSRIANGFRNWVTKDKITDAGCTFRALRRSALREVPIFNGMHRFLPTLLRLQGYSVKEVPVNHRPRTRGQTKYGIGNRMFRGIVDCFAMRWWRRRCVPGHRVDTDNGENFS